MRADTEVVYQAVYSKCAYYCVVVYNTFAMLQLDRVHAVEIMTARRESEYT